MTTLHSLNRGDAVRVRGERWRVVHVSSHDSCAVVELAGAEPANAGSAGRFLLPFEPLDRIACLAERPHVVRPAAWRRIAAAALAETVPAWQSLRAAAAADVLLLPYQLEPALALTRGLACRILLADEVGLGKTIQAGLIVAELLVRERDARVLIVTPASLRDQWRDELRDRFGIAASVIDAGALIRTASELPPGVNPWAIPRVAITSIDFLKRGDVIRSLEPLCWDLVAFDEAHALCGRSDRATAADLIAARARRLVIITATPHSGDHDAFARLRALGRVGEDDRLLTFRRSRIDAGVPRERVIRRLSVAPTPQERRMHGALAAYASRVSRHAPAETASAARLAMMVLARRASSSAASLARSVERRIALLGSPPEPLGAQLRLPLDEGQIPEDDEPLDELSAPGLPNPAVEQRWLAKVLALARTVDAESKVRALKRLLARTREPALVFTEYRDTLRHVVAALDMGVAVLHGGLSPAERGAEARRFTRGNAPVLVATDAASEGLNLHHRCRLVINLDVPWTPLRLEQRVGRVDRLGQQRRVHAITFVARGTPEESVAAALASRARRAEREAPFCPADDCTAGLRAEAIAEAARLEQVRQLTRVGAATWNASSRAVLTAIARARREHIVAIRFFFIDSNGTIVWDTIKGFALSEAGPRELDAQAVREWFDRAVNASAGALAAAAIRVHASELTTASQAIAAAVRSLAARERAMLERLSGHNARLAIPLIQPGLFDRRALRDADAQRRVTEEAVARATERIHALECQADLRAGDRTLVFAVASTFPQRSRRGR